MLNACFYYRSLASDKSVSEYCGGNTLANIKSAEKQARQALVRRDRNQQTKKAVRTSERKLRDAMASGAKDKLEELYKEFCSKISKAAQKGIIHTSTASRKMGRLASAMAAPSAKK